MKKDVADKLVKALRSGDYEQTKETLQDDYGYCCLGVLCNLAQKEGVKVNRDEFLIGEDLSDQINVLEWSGMKSNAGNFGEESLIDMNDNKNYNFNEIADVIEEKWEML